ncbi:MAG: UDP-N-acetylmuramate:L-alanyl-gamma-D-glutamyl-meso-diaminopimelate ligase [Acidobacteria bacterium]|nr:MAG: UDP-N-acetylmuramate:L-alanyl-gamma-D-glutamyl-meso-diaminopimelate ligase [Acidobacteriota bacterium]
MIAIGGTGMAPLACLLQELGHRVRGSDAPLYPPMSTLLAEAGITPHRGYDPAHLEPAPDLVIVGNAVPRSNPEVERAEELGLERASMPQALSRFLLEGRRPLVVAGTHGKTTTTALASWVYANCGEDPGYLIGGVPQGLERSFAVGSGPRFVVEGDEYNAAYFDRGPKFLHYRPQALILTSVEYDHADLYPSPEALDEAYRRLIALVPEDGVVVACGDHPAVRAMAAGARSKVIFYGLEEGNDVRPASLEHGPRGSRFVLPDGAGGSVAVELQLAGDHNVQNALAAWAAARHDGLAPAAVAAALAGFAGVKRRLEVLGTAAGVTVVDDFAHHPTAVGASLRALAARYPGRRLLALFEPRSLTAGRAFLQPAYRRAFAAATAVRLAPIFHRRRLADDERLDLEALVEELGRDGVDAACCPSTGAVLDAALAWLRPGDVAVTMSSGSFDDLPRRLLAALRRR